MRGTTLLVIAAVVAVLYFAREVFIPFALALLFSFLLGPLALQLRHWRLGRAFSVVVTVLLAVLVVAGAGVFIALQVYDVAAKLPDYQHTIRKKLQSFQMPGGARLRQTFKLLHETETQVSSHAPAPGVAPAGAAPDQPAVPVEIRDTAPKTFQYLQRLAGSVMHPLATAGIVTVFVIFMLIYREDLRDRLLRLMGLGQLHLTTQVLDDAAWRVSRYLRALLCVNTAYGLLIDRGPLPRAGQSVGIERQPGASGKMSEKPQAGVLEYWNNGAVSA